MHANLGETIVVGDVQYRVVRVVNKSLTLFQGAEGVYIIEESYLELKGSDGGIDFIELDRKKLAYTGPSSTIKALEPIQKGEDDE